MKKEFIIWGKPYGKNYETVLFTGAKTMYEAKKVSKILATDHFCTDIHIQILDLTNFNFVKEFTKR